MSGQARMQSHAWEVRVGQIESVLTFFGTLCSISIEIPATATCPAHEVYVQARRDEGGLEVEIIGNQYLPEAARLDAGRISDLTVLGWREPGDDTPNFSRFVATEADLGELARTVAGSLRRLGVRPDLEWSVSPPELGNQPGGLAGMEVIDPDDRDAEEQVLREGAGAALVSLIAGDTFTWAELIAAGLPRSDKQAELAMLFRPDCDVAFLRASSFHRDVISDPMLPVEVARAVLADQPTAYELRELSRRPDLSRADIAAAAAHSLRLARWHGRPAERFLSLSALPASRLTEVADQHDSEAVGMLRHPRCPESIVLRHLLARSARVRYAALAATRRRNLAIDSALVRAARDLPMTERPNTFHPYGPRVRELADRILEDR